MNSKKDKSPLTIEIPYALVQKINKWYDLPYKELTFGYEDFIENHYIAIRNYFVVLFRFYCAKQMDSEGKLPDDPDIKLLMSPNFGVEVQKINELHYPMSEIERTSVEIKDLFHKEFSKEVSKAKYIVNVFDCFTTQAEDFPTYVIPGEVLRQNSQAQLMKEIQKLDKFDLPQTKMKQLMETINMYSPVYKPTQTIAFKNARIINGKLVFDTEPEYFEYTARDFKINSPIKIPKAVDEKTKRIIDNYTHFNKEVHDSSELYRVRPFLEKEMAFAVYSTLARYTVGNLLAPFGAFFMFEDNNGTGGGRGKSLLTEALTRIINSGTVDSPSLSMAGAIDAKSITTPQVQINVAPRLMNVLSERQGGLYSDEEVAFIKSAREYGQSAVGKYQIQAQDTTFKGNIFTSSNFVPRFKEHSDAIKERFYGLEFTLKFKSRNNPEIKQHIASEEFLGSLIYWAFQFGFDNYENILDMEEHFKEQFDLLAINNNDALQIFHEAIKMRHDPKERDNFEYNKEGNVMYCKQNYFKYIFALQAGSVSGINRLMGNSGVINSQERQYASWSSFKTYLEAQLDRNTLKAIRFKTSRRNFKGQPETFFAVYLDELPDITPSSKRITKIERKWLEENGYGVDSQAEEVDIDDITLPPSSNGGVDNTPEVINDTPEETVEELEIQEVIDFDDLFEQKYNYDLNANPKEMLNYLPNDEMISPDNSLPLYIKVTQEYTESISDLVEQAVQTNKEFGNLPADYYSNYLKDMANIAKRYVEITGKQEFTIELMYVQDNQDVVDVIPKQRLRVGENIMELRYSVDDKRLTVIYRAEKPKAVYVE